MSPLNALSHALLNSIWQLAIIGAVFGALLGLVRRAQARSALATFALSLCLIVPALTFLKFSRPVALSTVGATDVMQPATAQVGSWSVTESTLVARVQAPGVPVEAPVAPVRKSRTLLMVDVWAVGVALMIVRLVGGLILVWSRRRRSGPASSEWQARLGALAQRSGIARKLQLRLTHSLDAPAVVGILRVTVLFPASAITNLSPSQVEALLLHELAHIRRHDTVINLLQVGVETLLFYHPVVWWVSSTLRKEREKCCDDAAVELMGDRLSYARALASLEAYRLRQPQFTLSAKGGPLMARVHRIVSPAPSASGGFVWLPLLVLLGAAVLPAALLTTTRSPIRAGMPGSSREVTDVKPVASSSLPPSGPATPGLLAKVATDEVKQGKAVGQPRLFGPKVKAQSPAVPGKLIDPAAFSNNPKVREAQRFLAQYEEVSGTVIGPGGIPVAGATVSWVPVTSAESPYAVKTDANGKFRMTLTAQTGASVELWARKGDMANGLPVVPKGGIATLEIRPNQLVTVLGDILDSTGQPLAGETVELFEIEGEARDSTSVTTGTRLCRMTTDRRGHFEAQVFGVPAILCQVRGDWKRRFVVRTTPGAHLTIPRQVMEPISVISGSLVNLSNRPLSDVTISCVEQPHASAITDKNGHFRLTGLRPGSVTLRATFKTGREETIEASTGGILHLGDSGATLGYVLRETPGAVMALEVPMRVEMNWSPAVHKR